MPNVNAVLAQEITRLAKRVVNSGTKVTRRVVAQHRHDVAGLKRQMADVLKRLGALEKHQPKELAVPVEAVENIRFRADGLKSHRAKLGISADAYGKLVGVSGLTIYNWESGKSRPRKIQLPKIVAARGLGKREALARLGMGPAEKPVTAKAAAPKPAARRGVFKETGAEFLTKLVGRKALITSAINAAWKKAGRAATADVLLMQMVKARKLKRTKVQGQRGSLYRVA